MNLIRKKIMRKCISFVLATLLLMQAFTPVISYARTVDPQSGNGSSGKLQFTLSDEGVLTWNAADGTSLSGATGYEVILRNNAGSL